jgi:hypothetical protein
MLTLLLILDGVIRCIDVTLYIRYMLWNVYCMLAERLYCPVLADERVYYPVLGIGARAPCTL